MLLYNNTKDHNSVVIHNQCKSVKQQCYLFLTASGNLCLHIWLCGCCPGSWKKEEMKGGGVVIKKPYISLLKYDLLKIVSKLKAN